MKNNGYGRFNKKLLLASCGSYVRKNLFFHIYCPGSAWVLVEVAAHAFGGVPVSDPADPQVLQITAKSKTR